MLNSTRNFGCRISDEYTYLKLKTIVMENEKLRITILVDKGTDIIEFLYKPLDIDFMWRFRKVQTPLINYIPSSANSSGNFMDYYEGGWQEILPNGGAPTTYKGAEIGQHGEISLIPWQYQILKDEPEEVILKLSVYTPRTPFYIEKNLSLKSNQSILNIEEKVVNIGDEPIEFMWGHHPSFGPPFLDENCIIDMPAKKSIVHYPLYHPQSRYPAGKEFNWPWIRTKNNKLINVSKIPPPSVKSADVIFIKELAQGWYGLTNVRKKVGFGMVWDKTVFPYVWYWQEFKGGYGYPWWGTTYNIALEPWSSYPGCLEEVIKNGTQLKLGAGKEIKSWLKAVVYTGISRIKEINPEGRVKK